MIRASIYGRLGGDPVERTTRNGNVMVTVSLAVHVNRFGEDEDTEWISLAAFGSVADALARHEKGDLLAAMGTLTRRRYTDRNGAEREGWSLTVEAIISARTTRPAGGKKRSSEPKAEPATAQQPTGDGRAEFGDEIPF